MTRIQWVILVAGLAVGIAGYIYMGSPGMAGQPMSDRQAELATKPVSELTAPELLSRLEGLASDNQDDAEPHYHIGVLLASQGRLEDAARAFQSALRRDEAYVPALLGLGGVVAQIDGEVTQRSADLHWAAWRVDPLQVEAGMTAGAYYWRAGERDQALSIWADVRDKLSVDAEIETFDAWVAKMKAG